MFERFSVFISGANIEVTGQAFPLGELTADILSIRPKEFQQLQAAADELVKLIDEDNIPTRAVSIVDQEKRNERFRLRERNRPAAAALIKELHSLLLTRRLFQLVAISEKRLQAILQTLTYPSLAKRYLTIVDDIYAFNQTMFWFIDQGLMRLDKLDAAHYAAALHAFYHAPGIDKMMVNFFCFPGRTFNWFDTYEIKFFPREMPGEPGRFAIYEEYAVKDLQAFLKIDFMRALAVGHAIRRCHYCKGFFLLTKGYQTLYCTRPIPENPKFTCRTWREAGKVKESAAGTAERRLCNAAVNRINADKSRGQITAAEADWARFYARELRDQAMADPAEAKTLEARLKPQALYGALEIMKRSEQKNQS